MSAGISLVSTFWTAFLAACLGGVVIWAAWALQSDRAQEFVARADLDAEDMPRRTWVSEEEARAAHPAGRDLSPAPAAGKVECGSCTVIHDLTQVDVTFLGVTPVGGLLEQWACPECGWSNVIPAAQGLSLIHISEPTRH